MGERSPTKDLLVSRAVSCFWTRLTVAVVDPMSCGAGTSARSLALWWLLTICQGVLCMSLFAWEQTL